MENSVTITVDVAAPLGVVWACWTSPDHVINWNHASNDWHTTSAESDLRPGGRFRFRMEARDGSAGFDFEGTFLEIVPNKSIEYEIDDARRVTVEFVEGSESVTVTETFQAEETNPVEMQRQGWQAILDNFKKYAEDRSDGLSSAI